MSSGYFGEPSLGNDRRGSSRKGKKNSDKPKQPQRGLGVAQLEKIRLHGQMGSNYHPSFHTPYFNQEDVRVQTAYSSLPSPSFSYSSLPSPSFSYSSSSSSPTSYGCHPSITMGLGEYERPNFIYGDLQPTSTASWNAGGGILETQHFMQPSVNTHLLNPQDPQQKRNKKHTSSSRGSSSQNSESSDTQEVDLELRLSI
ncbi:protein SPEAR3-like isoform X2 [Mangifera indica]|uniref:protein SPEAR3-like isoform X2 n=1 Tax=Mangifera indica TaxID=29780 RepID=UPI001CFC0BB0|nr:protein SPEAR3-like isoform X2 [Mangifera indica]